MENPEDFGSILRVASQRRAMNIENFFSVSTSIFQDTGENYFIDILAKIGEIIKLLSDNVVSTEEKQIGKFNG
nr:hypothetical protein [Sedimentibacter sp.]